jgi:hypothetical protein
MYHFVACETKLFPTMCTMQNDLSKFGSDVAVKLNNVDLPLLNITLHF